MGPAVVVVGSGAAGLAAALAAKSRGADVTVVEATPTLGGSTALSSGAVWLPNNAIPGTRAYLNSVAVGDVNENLVECFIDAAPRITEWLGEMTALRWKPLPFPDCHSELPGGVNGGRSLEPQPVQITEDIASLLRPGLPWRPRATLTELMSGISPEILHERGRTGVVVGGQALVGALLTAATAARVRVRTSARATTLLHSGSAVTGVQIDGEALPGTVILASGGFERDTALAKTFLGAPVRGLIGAPGARGDGLRMAMAAGAALGTMFEAWWCPTISVPGERFDGAQAYRMLLFERARPGSLMVDRHGRRFTNEAQSYHEVGRALRSFDRVPAWLVFDAEHRRTYPVGPLPPGSPDPGWLRRGNSLTELAANIRLPPSVLAETVERFNRAAADGTDPYYGRGNFAYDRAMGDPRAAHPTLRPLDEPPYYAIEVHAGVGGTKGGPRTDTDGRVLRPDGQPIPGLFAAGNAAASPFGLAYPGIGGTLGPALVFGVLAGWAAAA
ncbi:FAD-binding protein [Kibdelosporangium aridum]|uniref:FAD-binding protein n=1 Tax=Kibdelosporangium aridum TaxID=2030 RepID=A0A428Z5D9_KIBAR|nr:FAD-dependent oxidoreductase [Kibdelosporangium aridum]RSM81991.1 FAD-binding protein [Kibdelosporangium aridum]